MTGVRLLRPIILRVSVLLPLLLSVTFAYTQSQVVQSANATVAEPSAESLGDVMMVRHRYVAALEKFESIPDKSSAVWNKIGLAHHHLFALDEALHAYRIALSLDPHNYEAMNNLGAAYHGKKNYKMAASSYKKALKLEPHSAITLSNLGTTYFAMDKMRQGLRAYEKALVLDPKIFDPNQNTVMEEGSTREQRIAVNYSLAKLYATAGRQEEAMSALRKAVYAGFRDKRHLMEDKEFASLRETQEFQQFLAEEHL
jgi:tetratricopeptide (TPR) repeat protein